MAGPEGERRLHGNSTNPASALRIDPAEGDAAARIRFKRGAA
ncbi:MAG: hypothetical protein ACIAQ0_12470 [Phycisphaerales bacterium JB058]